MIDPDVRPATPHDAPQLAWLEAEARATLVELRGGERWLATHPPRAAQWDAVVDTDVVIAAHIDDVLVMLVNGPIAVVDYVYVSPQARELGFGDAMLAAALERARASGCELLEGSSLPGDRDTKNLYERAGIKARLITVSTPI